MAKFAINASGAMLLPSLVQVSESISGSVVPLAMFYIELCKYMNRKIGKGELFVFDMYKCDIYVLLDACSSLRWQLLMV